ncbi:helix-turn-helix domain-containing protein [Hyalangium versicolor]|uniref:helix-turn-helix domain-containing protein n=1 Tax=Hyalangium versicolor TaxID=2861190 RepID=UPI001CCC91DD|nr:helix-turn-helix transcriptional regulator [Hyalangium versicolor]
MRADLASTIGTMIRSVRLNAGLTMEQVAQSVDLPLLAYARMERGKLLPTPSTLVDLCLFFRVSANTLLGLPTVKA